MKAGAAGVVAVLSLLTAAPQASAQTPRDGMMRIIGHATVEDVPDYAVVSVGVVTKARTPTAALDQNSALARKIIEFAKAFGIGEQDIQTTSITINPVTRRVQDQKGGVRDEPDGYIANNGVRVKVTALARLGTFMRDVLDQGATRVNGVEFGLSTIERLTDEARTKAVESAVHQAELFAKAAKVKLGPIREIVHPLRTDVLRPGASAAGMPARPAPRSSVPVAAGTISVSAEVDITWTIE